MKNQILMLLSFCTLLLSCASENKGIKANDLEGTWVCIDAKMNNQKNELLLENKETQNPAAEIVFNNSVMRFEQLKDLERKEEQNFKIEGDKIISTTEPDLIFTINKFEKEILILSFNAMDMSFELTLKRKK
jgi:hypothetical protein